MKEQIVERLRIIIEDFIDTKSKEIFKKFNMDLSADSINGDVEIIDKEGFFIGAWRFDKVGESWEAVYKESISEDEDNELILEIEKTETGYFLRDWSFKHLF